MIPRLFARLATAASLSLALAPHAQADGGPIGITQAQREVKLGMTVAGRVESIEVREGTRVHSGQLLMHVDRSLEALEVRRRELLLADTAKLDELRLRELTLTDQVASARALQQSGGISRKQLEDEEIALQSAIAERKALEFAKRREQVELDLAREAYERRHLRSPIDGIVTRIVPRVGESVAPNEPVLTIVDISRVRFNGTFSAAAASALRVGQSVSIRIAQDGRELTRKARVSFVSPVADPSSGLVELIAEFDNADGSVRPGMPGQIQAVPGAGRR